MKKAAVKIIVVVAMAAAVFMNAIIPVGAADSDINFIITRSNSILGQFYKVTLPYTFDTYPYYGILLNGNIKENYTYSFVIQYSTPNTSTANKIGSSSLKAAIISELSETNNNPINLQKAINIELSKIDYIFSSQYSGNITAIITFNTNNIPIDDNFSIYFQFDAIASATIENVILYGIEDNNNEIYDIITNNINNIANEINNLITENQSINNSLSQIVTNTQQIEDIQNIINNNINTTNNKIDTINNNLEYLANVGAGNTIPNNGPSLDTAQQQLHNSEEALTNKSESLASRAASGINTAKIASTQFVSTITPAVTTVTGTVTQAIESLPQEIQPMVYSMPLLSFAVWLIGLKR